MFLHGDHSKEDTTMRNMVMHNAAVIWIFQQETLVMLSSFSFRNLSFLLSCIFLSLLFSFSAQGYWGAVIRVMATDFTLSANTWFSCSPICKWNHRVDSWVRRDRVHTAMHRATDSLKEVSFWIPWRIMEFVQLWFPLWGFHRERHSALRSLVSVLQ